tara:strand:+ start:13345 stop:13536 length:192 start_codon:yes stop_codon:yes gene_type:complete
MKKRNLFYQLPEELIILIYNYDNTYKELYKICMLELRGVFYFLNKTKVFKPSRVIGRMVTSFN